MKHIKNKQLLAILGFGIMMVSCNKYLNVNTDPNRPTDANITPSLIFTQAEESVGERGEASGSFGFLDEWIGYLAPNGGFVPSQNVIDYNIDFAFGQTIWSGYYESLYDLYLVKTKALASGDTAMAGASMVLSADLFQQLVDLYGDIPYSQAFGSVLNPTPAYDKAQDIYKSLELSLDTAKTYLSTTAPSSFASADIINHGDEGSWTRFANTLKLRLLIRQSNVPGFDPSADIAKISSTSGTVLGSIIGAGQSINVNPGYSNDVNKQNPYYATNGWSPTGAVANNSTNANEYIINILESTNDPREGRFFYPAGFDSTNGFVGNVFGDPVGTLAQSAASSYFGPALVGELLPGTMVGNGYGQDQFIYPSFESLFLYAEAVARGWVPEDMDAKTAYQNAVTESFVWLGVPDAVNAAATYYTSGDPTTDWTASGVAGADAEAKFIVYQKYIALTAIDPLEAYSDQRRLNFLTDNSYISTDAAKLSSTLPLRLLYPQTEYTSNGVNVGKEGTINPFTSKLFWEP